MSFSTPQHWLTLGKMLRVNAKKFANKIAVKDAKRQLTYEQLNLRTNKLANALLKLKLKKGDKIAIMLYNCIEYVEIYCAIAKIGLIAVPINWRLDSKNIEYILNNSDAKAIIVAENFVETINSIETKIKKVKKFISVGEKIKEYKNYEEIISNAKEQFPNVNVEGKDTWYILYTSGTTGVPKGVVRSHASYSAFFLVNAVEFCFSEKDKGMIIMPLFHVNSTFYGLLFLYIGGSLYIYREKDFNPEELLQTIAKEKPNFISLIPTHYALILALPEEIRNKYDVSSLRKLLCSSAPVRKDMKLKIMEYFKNSELYEAYGSTEAGLVTILKPDEQLKKLGSIGRECLCTDVIKILDEKGKEVKVGEVGELYSKGAMMFSEYYKMKEKTKKSFKDGFFSAGDLVKKDEDGYYYIVDRKNNMIISGGEHVYPSEVEEVIAKYEKVLEVAVIGIPHEKWGESVKAVVVLKENCECTEEEIINFCKDKLASFKKPKSVSFIKKEDMPRTASGKILHRVLRERYGKIE